MTVALLLLLAATPTASFDRTVRVPPADVRGLELTIRNRPGTVDMRYRTQQRHANVRAVVMAKADQPRFRAGRTVAELASTPYANEGSLRVHLITPGDYVILLDNRPEARQEVQVQVRGQIVYDPEPVAAWELPPQRKATVVAASLIAFCALFWWSGRKVVRAVNEKERRERPPL